MTKVLKMERLDYIPERPPAVIQKKKGALYLVKNQKPGYIVLFFWVIMAPLIITVIHWENPLTWISLLSYAAALTAAYLLFLISQEKWTKNLFNFLTWLIVICGPLLFWQVVGG